MSVIGYPASNRPSSSPVGIEFRMVASNPKDKVRREKAHDAAERLNQFFVLAAALQFADARIEPADLAPR